jgi:hypothetical protein
MDFTKWTIHRKKDKLNIIETQILIWEIAILTNNLIRDVGEGVHIYIRVIKITFLTDQLPKI